MQTVCGQVLLCNMKAPQVNFLAVCFVSQTQHSLGLTVSSSTYGVSSRQKVNEKWPLSVPADDFPCGWCVAPLHYLRCTERYWCFISYQKAVKKDITMISIIHEDAFIQSLNFCWDFWTLFMNSLISKQCSSSMFKCFHHNHSWQQIPFHPLLQTS